MKHCLCRPDTELLAVGFRPCYLSREFTSVIVVAVYILPSAGADAACDIVSSAAAKLQKQQPSAFLAITGDFNHVSLSARYGPWPAFPLFLLVFHAAGGIYADLAVLLLICCWLRGLVVLHAPLVWHSGWSASHLAHPRAEAGHLNKSCHSTSLGSWFLLWTARQTLKWCFLYPCGICELLQVLGFCYFPGACEFDCFGCCLFLLF